MKKNGDELFEIPIVSCQSPKLKEQRKPKLVDV